MQTGVLTARVGLRHYSPGLGRWTKRDPLGEDGGENLFAMTFNDPVGSFDILGLETCESMLNAAYGYSDLWEQIAALQDAGCLSYIYCGSCGGIDEDGKPIGGAYWPEGSKNICINKNITRRRDFKMALQHELQHAFDLCEGQRGSCSECMQDEMRAQKCSGQEPDTLAALGSCKNQLCSICDDIDATKVVQDAIIYYRQVSEEDCYFSQL